MGSPSARCSPPGCAERLVHERGNRSPPWLLAFHLAVLDAAGHAASPASQPGGSSEGERVEAVSAAAFSERELVARAVGADARGSDFWGGDDFRSLRSLEVHPRESGWKLFRRRRSPSENWWLVRSAQMLVVVTSGVVMTFGLFALRGRQQWLGASVGVAVGAAVVSGAIFEVALGVALGMALGVYTVCVAPLGVVVGPVGAAIGAAIGSATLGVSFGVSLGVISGRVPEAEGYSVRTVIAFFTALFRIPVYLFEVIAQTAARYWNSMTGRKSLHWVPVLHHELSYLPHPCLESHILAEADADPVLTRRVLDACSD